MDERRWFFKENIGLLQDFVTQAVESR